MADPGEGPPSPPLRGRKNFFIDQGSPLSKGLDDPPTPPPPQSALLSYISLQNVVNRKQEVDSAGSV